MFDIFGAKESVIIQQYKNQNTAESKHNHAEIRVLEDKKKTSSELMEELT